MHCNCHSDQAFFLNKASKVCGWYQAVKIHNHGRACFLVDFISRHCAFKSVSQPASSSLISLLPSSGHCHQSVHLPVHHAYSKVKRQSSNWKGTSCTLKKWNFFFSGIDDGISRPSAEWKLFQVKDHSAKTCILNEYSSYLGMNFSGSWNTCSARMMIFVLWFSSMSLKRKLFCGSISIEWMPNILKHSQLLKKKITIPHLISILISFSEIMAVQVWHMCMSGNFKLSMETWNSI